MRSFVEGDITSTLSGTFRALHFRWGTTVSRDSFPVDVVCYCLCAVMGF